MNLVVYTAIFGDRFDPLPPVSFPQTRHVLFTDRPDRYQKRGWEIHSPVGSFTQPRKEARRYKTLSHSWLPDATHTLWVDGNVTLLVDPVEIAKHTDGGVSLWTARHPTRNCVFDEARTCAAMKKDSPMTLVRQITAYEDFGFPRAAGLFETGLLLRKHSPEIALLNEEWFREIDKGSIRDQISLPFVRWKLGTVCGVFPGNGVSGCPYVSLARHGRNRLAAAASVK